MNKTTKYAIMTLDGAVIIETKNKKDALLIFRSNGYPVSYKDVYHYSWGVK